MDMPHTVNELIPTAVQSKKDAEEASSTNDTLSKKLVVETVSREETDFGTLTAGKDCHTDQEISDNSEFTCMH